MKSFDATAKSPDQKFWMVCKKDKIGNFECGYLQSNHRKVTDFGLLQDFKRMIMTFGRRVFSSCSSINNKKYGIKVIGRKCGSHQYFFVILQKIC